jgi:2-methylfumaryl-CoA isomerase
MLKAARDPVLVGKNPIFGRAANPSGFDYPAPGAIATIPQIERDPPRPAPLSGAYSEEVLADRLGLSASMIGDLHAKGIVGIPAKGTNQ